MRTIVSLAAATVMSLLVATPAVAATLSSPPIYAQASQGESLRCMLTNLGKKDVEITRRVIDADGTSVAGNLVRTVVPGETFLNNISGGGVNGALRCDYEGKISKRKVSITACVVDSPISTHCIVGP